MQPIARPVGIGDALPTAIDPFALSLNENPFPPLPSVRSALIRSIDAANRYPEPAPERLRSLIARHNGVCPGQVVLGNGATGVIMQALQALTTPGDTIVMALPTFDGYPILARMARLSSLIVPLDEHGHHGLDALAEEAANARVVVVCRPHNPTGTLEPTTEVVNFLRRVPRETIVLLDEAYIEFVAPEYRIDASALIAEFANVLIVRTFSKAYGLAGLRIGYGFASADMTRTLWAHQLPFGIAITGMLAVAASYDAEDQLLQRIRLITAERRYLRMRLAAMGIYTTESHANFLYLPSRGRQWRGELAGTGLRVRFYADGGARITVGSRASTRTVLSAARQAVALTAR